jgi:hypothetical protein
MFSLLLNSFDTSSVYVTGRDPYNYLDDDVPVLHKPIPTITALRKISSDLDPVLTITPEKKRSPKRPLTNG